MNSVAGTGRLALILFVLIGLAFGPGIAAADQRGGGSVVVESDETVSGLEAFGGSVLVRGTIDGDLTAVAGDVRIAESGHVTGSVEATAGNVEIAGTVDGNVEAAAGSITIAETAAIGGSVDAGAGSIRIEGTIAGDVTAGAETIHLGPAASIGGDLTYDGRLEGNREAVAGQVVHDPAIQGPNFGGGVPVVWNWIVGIYAFLATFLLGALVVLVAPRFSREVADRARGAPLRAGATGLLGLVAALIVLVLLLLTIVGIPLALVGGLVLIVVTWVGSLYGRIAVGYWLLSYVDRSDRWSTLVVGLVVVAIAVRIPYVGWLVNLLVFLLGLGALVLVVNDRRADSGPETTATGLDAQPE